MLKKTLAKETLVARKILPTLNQLLKLQQNSIMISMIMTTVQTPAIDVTVLK